MQCIYISMILCLSSIVKLLAMRFELVCGITHVQLIIIYVYIYTHYICICVCVFSTYMSTILCAHITCTGTRTNRLLWSVRKFPVKSYRSFPFVVWRHNQLTVQTINNQIFMYCTLSLDIGTPHV